jgi:hypothetical protein
MDRVCEDKIQPFIDNAYLQLATYVKAFAQRMQMKREGLSDKGIWTAKKIEPKNWFLNDKLDIRSSFYLEETATEFDVQGLELDYSIIAWDQKIMFDGTKWIYRKFNYREWSLESEETKINYLVNSMRVLLTRSRQGYVLFLPKKIENDLTSDKDLIENTYKLLKQIGIEEI